jgi:general secretion pathway protein G
MEWVKKKRRCGFSLLELLISVSIIGLLSAIALPGYRDYVDSVDNGLAAAGVDQVIQALERYYIDYDSFPLTLAAASVGTLQDPWGNTYLYLLFDENTKVGEMRKDRNLVPVNDDYDLYSMGKNGTTSLPFNSAPGRDDIVRANNGRFIGLAEDY